MMYDDDTTGSSGTVDQETTNTGEEGVIVNPTKTMSPCCDKDDKTHKNNHRTTNTEEEEEEYLDAVLFQHWTRVTVNNTGSNDKNNSNKNSGHHNHHRNNNNNNDTLLVSNRIVHWNPNTVQTIHHFLSTHDDIRTLQTEMSSSTSSTTNMYYEGFDGPRRLIRFYNVSDYTMMNTGDGSAPNILLQLRDRLFQETGLRAKYIKMEEYIPLVVSPTTTTTAGTTTTDNNNINNSGSNYWKYDPNMISTFPYNSNTTTCNGQQEPYFIAEIPITILDENDDDNQDESSVLPLIQNWNQPYEQEVDEQSATRGGFVVPQVPISMRWRLQSEHHMTYVHVPYNSIIIRTFPDNKNNPKWRNSRYMYATTPTTTSSRRKNVKQPIRVLQFYNFDTQTTSNNASQMTTATVPNHSTAITNNTNDNDNQKISGNNNNTGMANDVAARGSSGSSDTFGYVPTNPTEIAERTRRLQLDTTTSNSSSSDGDGSKISQRLSDLVTIIITTSPIKSHPSTDVIQQAMETFLIGGGPTFAHQCHKVIICDGYRTKTDVPLRSSSSTGCTPHEHQEDNGDDNDDDENDNIDGHTYDIQLNSSSDTNMKSSTSGSSKNVKPVSHRHCNDKQAMRNGIVTEQQAKNYSQYKQNLHQHCRDNATNTKSVFYNTQIIELSTRHGYGYAVRHVLRDTDAIKTPYVCVIQHDRTFVRPTPILETLHAMWDHPNIKYVGFSMRSNLMYRDIFIAKYGMGNKTEYDDMILYVPQLRVASTQYGPNSASTNALSVKNERVKQNICALCDTYKGSAQATIERKVASTPSETSPLQLPDNNTNIADDSNHACSDVPPHRGTQQISLVPTLYWYDNVHICETNHYRDFIFHPSYKMVAKGGFIEDKLSPILKRTVERLGLRDGHSRFGCYLLDDHSGMFFTGHLDGGSYMSPEERKELLASQQQHQQSETIYK